METKERVSYTPGPWKVAPDSGTTVYGDDDGAVRTVVADTCARGKPDEQERADARLIAAAPDLLAALKKAVQTIRAFDALGLSDSDVAPSWRAYQQSPEMRQINAAIMKAEGR